MNNVDYIKRMENELEELLVKMRELHELIPELDGKPEKKYGLMGVQLVQMGVYADVLTARIKLAKEE